MNREQFAEVVEGALAHLYDHPRLETHPLARLLVSRPVEESRSHELQRLLLDAIQELRPSSDVPYSSLGWRKYRYLHLRYVESLGVAQVAEELAVTPRHLRRSHHEAVAAVASVLWDRYPNVHTAELGAEDDASGDRSGPAEQHRSLLDEEVARLDTASGLTLTDFRETLAGTLATVAPLASARQVSLAVEVPDGLPSVAIDRTILRQVLLNLLITAVERGRGQVRVLVSHVAGDSGGVAVRVRLVGGAFGVEEKASSEPAHPSDGEPAQLRLEVSRRLLEKHGGSLGIEPGGRSLLLLLPTAEPLTILVVDDNLDVVRLLERYLAGGLYRVISASSGAEALRLAREERPALVTLDVMMPAQDGWEVLQSLQAHPETYAIPVIVCSVLHERELALLLGAADFLPKPITQAVLLRALARLRSGSGPSAPRSSPPYRPSAPSPSTRADG